MQTCMRDGRPPLNMHRCVGFLPGNSVAAAGRCQELLQESPAQALFPPGTGGERPPSPSQRIPSAAALTSPFCPFYGVSMSQAAAGSGKAGSLRRQPKAKGRRHPSTPSANCFQYGRTFWEGPRQDFPPRFDEGTLSGNLTCVLFFKKNSNFQNAAIF